MRPTPDDAGRFAIVTSRIGLPAVVQILRGGQRGLCVWGPFGSRTIRVEQIAAWLGPTDAVRLDTLEEPDSVPPGRVGIILAGAWTVIEGARAAAIWRLAQADQPVASAF